MQWITRGALMAACFFGLITGAHGIHAVPAAPVDQPLLAGASIPSEVQHIVARACQDCHSNNTVWPWYSRIYPMSQLIAADVQQGRSFLNLSDWSTYSRGRKLGYLAAMSGAAEGGLMPPSRYSLLHADARLTPAERQELAAWAQKESSRLRQIRWDPARLHRNRPTSVG